MYNDTTKQEKILVFRGVGQSRNLIIGDLHGSYRCHTLMDMESIEYRQSRNSKELYGFCSI